jgi:Holliday junction resolvase RusA-like endonuclease
MNGTISITIPGRVGILKNGKSIFVKHGRLFVIPKQKYVDWEKMAVLECKSQFRGETIDTPVEMRAKFYFPNHQHEIDCSNGVQGPEDVLQKAGVIKDDKLIYREVLEKFFGHEPRVEIKIFAYKENE